ncbi:Vacuolar amino acid transporter 4 [Candida viswanathii]|uniref:Vacuolar amino acid transporter 4 n=1 Tax=Candida viswanathii TaxID=5486 RepID=A0A367YET3_9ASCO|nr:Vacuolar amino acid transporter 4 [Candida viswanathii]
MSSSTNLAFQNSPSLKQASNSPSFRLPSPRTIPQMPSSGSLHNISNGTPGSSHNHELPDGSYDEQVSHLNSFSSKKNLDLKAIGKHLISQEDSLKSQGGDITRRLYHQMENVNDNGSIKGGVLDPRRLRTRSASFSSYLEETRRGSTASDINIPGGFRREFLINKALQKNQTPPNFLTQNFMEFLSIYGHFAGEDFNDEEDDDEEQGSPDHSDEYDDVFDEESSLLNHERRPNLPKQLPKRKHEPQPKGTASIAKTFFLLFKALVGSGVLFLPRAFYNGGLLFSIVTLSLFGALTYFCYIGLIDSKKTLKLSSFGELGYKTYGKPLKYSILVSIILSQVGFVATYILFTSENMIAFLEQFLGTTPEWLNRANLVIIQCILLIPLVLIRNLTKLSMVSLISSIFIVIGLLIIFYFSGVNLLANGVGPNITSFNPNSWTMLIGVAVTSFEGIGLILPIESSMAQPEKFPMVLSVSMFFITLIFVSIGTIGYLSFGDQIRSIIILNLPQDNIFVKSILILYSVAVFLTAPLQLFPAIKIGESLIFNRRSSKKTDDDAGRLYHHSGKYNPFVKWLKNGFRSISVVLICLVAYLNADNIDKFVSFNGCFACIPLVYIYPPMIHLRTATKKNWFTYADYLLIVVGILTVIYSSYQIIFLN